MADRHGQLRALIDELELGMGELKNRTEELPDIVGVYFKDCFAVLDPGLAMVEDSLVRDAAYAKLAKLRVHAGVQARTACTVMGELDDDIVRETNGRILSRDKKFLEGVRASLLQAVAALEELANVGTEGVATKAEVREMQMENRALRSTAARGEWKKSQGGAELVRARQEVLQLTDQVERSAGEISRLQSRSRYLSEQNSAMLTQGLVEAIAVEEGATRELSQKLLRERETRNKLETELLKAEERVSMLMQAELETKGALAKVIRTIGS